MSTEPRRHHYLPQFYLSGFTTTGEPDGQLSLIGLKDGRRWRGTPNTVGHQRDFYRVEGVPGIEPNDLERGFADFEGRAAKVIRSISAKDQLPDDSDDFSFLINLVALMLARVPRTRDVFSKPLREVSEMLAQIMGLDEEDQTVREMLATGAYTIEVSQAYQLKQLLRIVDIVLPVLAQRLWSLMIVPDDVDFVTSDCPVALVWTIPRPPSPFGPGFGMAGTDVTFPLTRRLALLGRFEGPAETIRASRLQVANINARTCSYGGRFVCSSTEDLVWLMRDGTVGNAAQLIAALTEKPVSG